MSILIPKTISWPLGGIDESGRLTYSRNEDSVREVLLNILLTRPGERLMRSEFGGGILDFIHLPNNQGTRQLIANTVKKSIQLWEPRIVVEDVVVSASTTSVSEVQLTVQYCMRYNQRPQSFSIGLNLENV